MRQVREKATIRSLKALFRTPPNAKKPNAKQKATPNTLPSTAASASTPFTATPSHTFPVTWNKHAGDIAADLFADDAGRPYPRFPAKLLNFAGSKTPFHLFLHMLPNEYVEDTIVPLTNRALCEEGYKRTDMREFVLWSVYWFAMT
jgi:hypothetical protein